MATRVSPGVTVTVEDDSMYFPATSPTVPLFFIATADEKTQPSGANAEGTFESNVVRTIAGGIPQSISLYGVPRFLRDAQDNPLHGDCRNEYGLFAMNQFLGVGSYCYAIRANVNLNDDRASIIAMWRANIATAAATLENLVATRITEFNDARGYIPQMPEYKVTVTRSELLSDVSGSMVDVYAKYSFRKLQSLFEPAQTPELSVYANGYNMAATGTYPGFVGLVDEWIATSAGMTVGTEWSPAEAAALLIEAANDFMNTVEFLNQTQLGSNDAARRVAIIQAMQASINSNQDIRSDRYDYNIILAPGYHEVADELLNLVADQKDEVFAIGDVPFDVDPEGIVDWADSLASTRQHSAHIAYYYPHGLASNLDGYDIFCASSGIALRTYTYSDQNSELWFAPAGPRRGQVTGVSKMGRVKGILGTATEFVQETLSDGQQANMYKTSTNLNIIPTLYGRGILVLGQKTSAPTTTAMDRVNVSRLVKYLKRLLRKGLFDFLFEPNDEQTRTNVRTKVTQMLADIVSRRGLYDFAVQCDENNNTGTRIDRNELWVDVAIKPVKAVEFIYVPMRIVNTDTEI